MCMCYFWYFTKYIIFQIKYLLFLYSAILLTCDVHMFEAWVMEFGKQAIIWSSRYFVVYIQCITRISCDCGI